MIFARRLVALLAVGVLAACGGGDTKTGPERRTAAGEVLGGTITDDMLPLDTVRSQAPLLREAGQADSDDADTVINERSAGPAPTAATTSDEADQPEPAPVETPESE